MDSQTADPSLVGPGESVLTQEALGTLVVNNAVVLAPNSAGLFQGEDTASTSVVTETSETSATSSTSEDPSAVSSSNGDLPAAVLELCEGTDSLLYCVYTVQEGDTLSSIAATFELVGTESVAPWELLVHSNQPDIVSEDDVLQIGHRLRIPLGNGAIHTVLSAQTLIDIAERYDVSTQEIAAVAANGISDADLVRIGQDLLIPSPNRLRAPIVIEEAASAAADDTGQQSDPEPVAVEPAEPVEQAQPVQSASGFIWPVGGPITSYFSGGHPLGIDIDLFQNAGAAIAAAGSGVVTFAGGNPCCSYGLYVIVDHGNGFQTLYAHLASIWVNVGESVGQGQGIGGGGSTGYSTGSHLHFEVHLNGVHVDPLAYLP